MAELIRASMPFQVLACALAFLLCLVPLLGSRGRTVIAVLFLLISIGFAVDLLVLDHSQPHTVEVPNFFKTPNETEPHRFVMAVVTAPPSHWHLFMIALAAIPGLSILLRRHRAPAVPDPVWHTLLVFLFVLTARLGLDKTGAPEEICWGVGGTPTLLVTLPFFGLYCGRRGQTFGVFVRWLLLLALLQRLCIVAWAWFATTRQLGTHLDAHLVDTQATGGIDLPLFGVRMLADDFDRWLWPILVPQLAVFVPLTLVAGIVLGGLPRWWSSRKAGDAGGA